VFAKHQYIDDEYIMQLVNSNRNYFDLDTCFEEANNVGSFFVFQAKPPVQVPVPCQFFMKKKNSKLDSIRSLKNRPVLRCSEVTYITVSYSFPFVSIDFQPVPNVLPKFPMCSL
jgi:hypothetical protein